MDALMLIVMITNKITISRALRCLVSLVLLHSSSYARSINDNAMAIPRFVIDIP